MRMKTCTSCGGTGTINSSISKGVSSNICQACGGSGQVVDHSAPSTGGGTCFPAGTLVRTAGGRMPIERIEPGDEVIAVARSGLGCIRRVSRRWDYGLASITELSFECGSTLRVTEHHNVGTRNGWKRVSQLRVGDALDTFVGCPRIVKSIRVSASIEVVFNIAVEGESTYVADGLVVHSFTVLRRPRAFAARLAFAFRSILAKLSSRERIESVPT